LFFNATVIGFKKLGIIIFLDLLLDGVYDEKSIMAEKIKIIGARQHNLKNITVEIPKQKMTVITGLSGSGKSSLAFDTLYMEGQRRYVESLSTYARQFFGSLEKPDVDHIQGLSPAILIDQKTASSNPRSTVGTITEIYHYLRLLYARIGQPYCPECNKKLISFQADELIKKAIDLVKKTKTSDIYVQVKDIADLPRNLTEFELQGKKYTRAQLAKLQPEQPAWVLIGQTKEKLSAEKQASQVEDLINQGLRYGSLIRINKQCLSTQYFCPNGHAVLPDLNPKIFSFNSPLGACEKCHGLGMRKVIDPKKLIPSPGLTLAQGAIHPWGRKMAGTAGLLKQVTDLNITIDKPYDKLTKAQKKLVLGGDLVKDYEGAVANLERRYLETDSEHIRVQIEKYMKEEVCDTCEGQRLNPTSLAVKVKNKTIGQLSILDVENLIKFFNSVKFEKAELNLISQAKDEIIKRLEFLKRVGVGYLSLNRSSNTLAGGEAQRVRLATQLGSQLSGVIYILDEPTIGLHPNDLDPMLEILQELKAAKSTVVVVEHDQKTMEQADYLIDMGPGAGVNGGEIVAQGTPAKLMSQKNKCLTAQYLTGEKEIPAPSNRRKGIGKYIEIKGAKQHNLKNLNVKIPLGKLVCFTGVSGSGKSTLLYDILGKALAKHFYRSQAEPGEHKEIKGIKHLDKVINIDQSSIGRTPRSNPATYTNVFNLIRKEFNRTALAKQRKYDASQFSFNVRKGRCEHCAGQGFNKVEMYFLDDVYLTCPKCKGDRYNRETLEVEYNNKNIAQVLEMTVDEAREFFLNVPKIRRKLEVLQDVGLGYVRLGQSATTLSGGEAQRVKLAKELSRKSFNQTLYILDEPTTGLHFEDIKKLLNIIGKLVDRGNTVLVIEHNLDVLKTADWIIDLGPGGGEQGGGIVAQGTPEQIVKNKKSITGKYLKKTLS